MEQTTSAQTAQQTNLSRSGVEMPVDYNNRIDQLTLELNSCRYALNEKLKKNETDINGICSYISRLEDQIRECQYQQSQESAADPGNTPRNKAKALIGQGIVKIRPQAATSRTKAKDSKPREVIAKPLEGQ